MNFDVTQKVSENEIYSLNEKAFDKASIVTQKKQSVSEKKIVIVNSHTEVTNFSLESHHEEKRESYKEVLNHFIEEKIEDIYLK